MPLTHKVINAKILIGIFLYQIQVKEALLGVTVTNTALPLPF